MRAYTSRHKYTIGKTFLGLEILKCAVMHLACKALNTVSEDLRMETESSHFKILAQDDL